MGSRQAKLGAWLGQRAAAELSPADFAELLTLLSPVSESDLRHLLRESGAPLHPLVAGVNQNSFETLRDSLLALAQCYETASAEDRRNIRNIVITAKDHAKLAARNRRVAEEKRARKSEMAAWMLTWLENPTVFPLWVSLRAKALGIE